MSENEHSAMLLFIALVAALVGEIATVRGDQFIPNPLPAYCNSDYPNVAIDSLSEDELGQVSELKQVLVMIRHGSRTPYMAGIPCWEDYDVQWNNCNVTDLVLPSDALYNYSSQARPEPWLFRLIYDAWPDELGGNCMTGQLMREGYLQELSNGNALRAAYLNQSTASLNIFDTADYAKLDTGRMYFRSDDEQRTVMSGQAMLSTFFDVTAPNVVAWHTMDDAIDQIAPNAAACPALVDAQAAAYSSYNFTHIVNDTGVLTDELNAVWGAGQWSYYSCIDCLMTTVCTGRGIPSNPETGVAMNQTLFDQAVDQATAIYAYQATYNNSWYSKLGMGRTIYNMRTHLEAAVNNDADAVKFALWSAHDTSIMPFLAALMGESWDAKWARYAAMVTIELYANSDGSENDLFRLTYNGEALAMPGCDGATLCDVDTLLGLMAFAQEDMPCAPAASTGDDDSSGGGSSSSSSSDSSALGGLTLAGWAGMCALSGALGIVLGAVLWNGFVTNGRTKGGYCGIGATDTRVNEKGDIDNSARPMTTGGLSHGTGNPLQVGGEDAIPHAA